jgi:hypothetical protein
VSATETPQISLYEKEITDKTLEKALDRRQALREERKELNRQIRDAEGSVSEKIQELELGEEAPVRVGRYLIALRRTEAKDVAFTRGGGTRLQISLLDL